MKPDKELCEPLLAYIDYFKQCKKTKWVKGGWLVNGTTYLRRPQYDDEVWEFVRYMEHCPLMNHEHRTTLTRYFGHSDYMGYDFFAAVAVADFDTVLAMLSYCIRGERFARGSLGHAIELGLIYKILIRIKELCDE